MKDELFELKSELISEFSKIKEVVCVILYGSYARGDYSKRHSDFDLFIMLNKRKANERLKERINHRIWPVGTRYSRKIHNEYQGTSISDEDKSLIRKLIEEGIVLYSAGVLFYPTSKIGLKQYIVYSFSSKDSSKKTLFAKILHGRTSSYYKEKKKITKEYAGIVDENEIIDLGRGCLMVLKSRQKDMESLFQQMNINFKIKRIVYS